MTKKEHLVKAMRFCIHSIDDTGNLFQSLGYIEALHDAGIIKRDTYTEIAGLILALGEIYDEFPETDRKGLRFRIATTKTIDMAFKKAFKIEEV